MEFNEDQKRTAVAAGLRAASTGIVCVLISEYYHLDLAYMAPATVLTVATDLEKKPFQKAIEDLVGRFGGYAYCVLLVILFRNSPLLLLTLLSLALLPIWYLLASGRLTYGSTLAGVYMVLAVATSIDSPDSLLVHTMVSVGVQLLIGVLLIELLDFVTGVTTRLTIEVGPGPLFPLKWPELNRSMMLTTLSLVALIVPQLLGLPVSTLAVAALLLGVAPTTEQLRAKAWQRFVAVWPALAYAIGCFLLLQKVPSFLLYLLLLFLLFFSSTYLARTLPGQRYFGFQLGYGGCMILIVPANEIANLSAASNRVVGVIGGFTLALIVQVLWPTQSSPALANTSNQTIPPAVARSAPPG